MAWRLVHCASQGVKQAAALVALRHWVLQAWLQMPRFPAQPI